MKFYDKILTYNALIFDKIEENWERETTQKHLGSVMVVTFVFSLLIIQLNVWQLTPLWVSQKIGTNHFFAIEIVFVLLLVFEVVSLILNLSQSVAISMAKQFEIFSLILLRNSFKAIGHLPEPIDWANILDSLYLIMSDAVAGILMFGGVVVFKQIAKHRPINENKALMKRFVASKKIVSVVLIFIFILLGSYDLFSLFIHHQSHSFFNNFFTILIFSDILIVIISLRYSYSYTILFRNSGFAIATVLLRLALTAPGLYSPLLGILALVLVLAISYIYNKFPINDKV